MSLITPRSDKIIASLNIVSRKLQGLLDEQLAPLHLTSSNYYFLLKIDQERTLTQDQLFRKIYLSPSNVTRRLDQLVALGLVVKERSTDDRRSWNISLTLQGKILVPKIKAVVLRVNKQFLTDIPADEINVVKAFLEQTSANLD
ncbi:MarR family winged helix-turn-helix transcriptional regulator [Furfurilactobacillus sp. WILCCON 0119]|uniref:MarR family winged helix-turn-helix transcriptional regulator n=1 Tax=Furfurilactobacillus entadae TaxID=2922307 RepID=UPI0035F0A27C